MYCSEILGQQVFYFFIMPNSTMKTWDLEFQNEKMSNSSILLRHSWELKACVTLVNLNVFTIIWKLYCLVLIGGVTLNPHWFTLTEKDNMSRAVRFNFMQGYDACQDTITHFKKVIYSGSITVKQLWVTFHFTRGLYTMQRAFLLLLFLCCSNIRWKK